MKIQSIKALVKKDLKKIIKEPTNLFLAFLFPIIMTSAFGLAFGSLGGSNANVTYSIGIVDFDNSVWSSYFEGNLSASKVLDGVTYKDKDLAQSDLEQGNIDAFVVIPNNFAESATSYWDNPTNPNLWINTSVELSVDQGSLVASSALPPLIQQILVVTLYGEQTKMAQPIEMGNPSFVNAEHLTQFDIMTPGLFIFVVIFITMIVAEGFTIERTTGLLSRIQVTPTTPTDIITSSVISYLIIAVCQVGIVFVVSGIMGFNPKTDISGIVFSFAIVSLLALTSIGFGLIGATVAKSPGAATGISFVFIMPQMLLGTFIPNISKDVSQFMPSFYATDALTSVLLRGADITSPTVLYDFGIMIVLGLGVIVAGIGIFTKFGKD